MLRKIASRCTITWNARVARPRYLKSKFAVRKKGNRLGTWGYIGYVGCDNYGDDVLYHTITRKVLLNANHEVAEIRRFPLSVFNKAVDLSVFTAMIIGGGTLIYRDTYLDLAERAIRENLPIIVAGTGVADVSYWKEFTPSLPYGEIVERWNKVMQSAVVGGVRGPRSAALLEKFGAPAFEVIGDPALSVTQNIPLRPARTGTIGINLGSHDPIWGDQDHLCREVIQFAKAMLVRDSKILFIALSPIDYSLGVGIGREINSPNYEVILHDQNIEEAIKACDLVVGQRLHSVILAAAHGIPTISLSYQPKCMDFLESINLSHLALRTDEVTSARLIELVESVLNQWTGISNEIINQVRRFQHIQQSFGEQVTRKMENLLRQ